MEKFDKHSMFTIIITIDAIFLARKQTWIALIIKYLLQHNLQMYY